MKKTWDDAGKRFTWTFGSGVSPLTLSLDRLSPEIIKQAAIYGIGVKMNRAAALPVNPVTHKSESDSVKRDAMAAMAEQLAVSGVWNAERVGAKAKVVNVDALVAALVSVRQKNPVGIRQYIEGCSEEKRVALSNSKEFAAAYVTALANQRPVLELTDEIDAEIDAIAD